MYMILTTHALIGAALGKHVANPWLVASLAIPLHFFLDTFRHGEYLGRQSTFRNTWWKVALDLSAPFFLIAVYLSFSDSTLPLVRNILLGMFASMFPDLLTVLYWKLRFNFLYRAFKFHEFVHPYPKGDRRYDWSWRNGLNDILFSAVAILLLIL